MELREKIVDVLDTELPYTREGLLNLADKIIAGLPEQPKPKVELPELHWGKIAQILRNVFIGAVHNDKLFEAQAKAVVCYLKEKDNV